MRLINPVEEIDNIIKSIKDYFVKNGPDSKAVIGISGGKDSTIAAALLVRALGKDRVIGVIMPQHVQADITDSFRVCEILGIDSYVINIGATCDKLNQSFIDGSDLQLTRQSLTNTPARIRMATLYMVAAAVGGRVINTGNASEAYVGYTTKYGDLAGDFAVLREYYVREVRAIGNALEELPYELVNKTPSDGLSGKTDEENMGFTYAEVDALCLDKEYPDYDTYLKIQTLHERNRHKECIRIPGTPYPHRYSDNEEEENPWLEI